jgi:hypothetical protein
MRTAPGVLWLRQGHALLCSPHPPPPPAARLRPYLIPLARGDTVILTENNSNDSKITVQILKE